MSEQERPEDDTEVANDTSLCLIRDPEVATGPLVFFESEVAMVI